MWTADNLAELSSKIRAINSAAGPPEDTPPIDDALVSWIEAEVREYRAKFFTRPVPQLPPEPLRELLPAMGWLIYEASLSPLWSLPVAYDTAPEPQHGEFLQTAELIRRLANVARHLVWPEFGARALGAIRVEALVESKRDSEEGFDNAWILHNEAAEKYETYLDTLGREPDRKRFARDLDEVFLQLALAETGTACRTAERVIGRWREDFSPDDAEAERHHSQNWIQKIFLRTMEGVETGEQALAVAERIGGEYHFTHRVTVSALTLVTGLRNPSIMTCRAILLAYSLCPAMKGLGRIPPAGSATWEDFQQSLLGRFDVALRPLLKEVRKADGSLWPLSADHSRSLVQICLHLGLVSPGHELPEVVHGPGGLTLHVVDDEAVETMSAWLAALVRTDATPPRKQRGDANIIGSSSMPDFNASVEACRRDAGAAADYTAWRVRWFELDRYANDEGRRAEIAEILGVPEEDFPPSRGEEI